MTPALVGVAHGSRDPRSAATVAALMDVVRARHPGLDVRTAFLDLAAPRLRDVLGGVDDAVVVPLLLGHAHHARVDVPGAVARSGRSGVAIADVLGPSVEHAALARLAEAVGALDDPELGVVVAGVGSSHAQANAVVAAVAAGWRRRFGWSGAMAAFATAEPSVADAIARLRAGGARRVAVAQWLLAPGLLPDRIAQAARAAGAVLGAPLGPHPAVADLVVARYAQAHAVPPGESPVSHRESPVSPTGAYPATTGSTAQRIPPPRLERRTRHARRPTRRAQPRDSPDTGARLAVTPVPRNP